MLYVIHIKTDFDAFKFTFVYADFWPPLPVSCSEPDTEPVRRVLTVQEKLCSEDLARPPPAELYVNLLDEEEQGGGRESDDTASTVSLSKKEKFKFRLYFICLYY